MDIDLGVYAREDLAARDAAIVAFKGLDHLLGADAEDDAADAGPVDGAATHDARLGARDERACRERAPVELRRRLGDEATTLFRARFC